MDSKKHSRIIAAICISALAVFSIFVFPFIIAASPDNMEIETIETEDVFPAEEPYHVPEIEAETVIEPEAETVPEPISELTPEPGPYPEAEVVIDVNAISEEQAIALAWELYMFPDEDDVNPAGERRGHATKFIEAKYVESTDPASDPSWFLLFSYRYWGVSFAYIPEGLTQEEALNREMEQDIFGLARFSMGTDNFGVPVIKWESSGSHYEMIELNALSGEWIGSGMTHPVYNADLDEFILEDNIRKRMDYWWLITKTASGEIIRDLLPGGVVRDPLSGEIIRDPLFHEEFEGERPVPTPVPSPEPAPIPIP